MGREEEIRRQLDVMERALQALRRELGAQRVPAQEGLVEIPDTDYDPAWWQGADDEGVGCRHERDAS
ncbi:hypothetical protein ACFQZC_15180 [Streptacidiphilus monticola]